ELAESLRAAPRTPRNLRVLGEALEKLEHWPELAEIRRVELELQEDPKEAAKIAAALAHLHDDRLRDLDGTARFFRPPFELDPSDLKALRALAQLFQKHQRWSELVD